MQRFPETVLLVCEVEEYTHNVGSIERIRHKIGVILQNKDNRK